MYTNMRRVDANQNLRLMFFSRIIHKVFIHTHTPYKENLAVCSLMLDILMSCAFTSIRVIFFEFGPLVLLGIEKSVLLLFIGPAAALHGDLVYRKARNPASKIRKTSLKIRNFALHCSFFLIFKIEKKQAL